MASRDEARPPSGSGGPMDDEGTTGSCGGAAVVPAISVPSSVACLRSLGGRGVRTIAVSELAAPPAFRSRYCDETESAPSPHTDLEGYRDVLLSLAARPDVATVIPVREEDVYTLATNRAAFADHVATPWPDRETLAAVQDRVQLFEIAADAGVSAPETQRLDEVSDWDRPWIVKSRYALLAAEYVDSYPPDRCAAPPTTRYLQRGATPDIEGLVGEMGHLPLCQAHVPTQEEYGFFAIYDHGEALATFQHRQRRGYSYAGGASAFRESIELPALERAGRALLDALEWHGVAMVEFLRDEETGEFLLMEVNPRFWSSLPFSVRAGADFPAYYWDLATGHRDRIEPGYEVGTAGHLIRGELLHLASILFEDNELVEAPSFPGTLVDVLRSMAAHPRFDYLTRDDPWPFVRDMTIAMGELGAHLAGVEGPIAQQREGDTDEVETPATDVRRNDREGPDDRSHRPDALESPERSAAATAEADNEG